MNSLDTVLQSEVPMVMVPRYEALPPIRPNSHRYLSCADGIYLEVDRPWINGVFKVSDCTLPYGEVSSRFALNIRSGHFAAILHAFVTAARQTSPQEHAAWATFHPEQGDLRYFAPEILSVGHGHVQYARPNASPDSLPAIDLHSHGLLPAFFSQTDNNDDLADDLKIAIVIGNLDRPEPTAVARLVGLGLNVNISEWVKAFVQNGVTETT